MFLRDETLSLVMINMAHRDGDPDKTKEEYDNDNHSDQENPNNDEYKGKLFFFSLFGCVLD